jgi:hypothetical protein
MNQTAIEPDFMPLTEAGPQCHIRIPDGSLIVGSVEPDRAEKVIAVGQKPSFVNGHS